MERKPSGTFDPTAGYPGAGAPTKRILYLTVGDLDRPRTGMNQVVAANLRELLEAGLPVDAVVVSISPGAVSMRSRGRSRIWQLSATYHEGRGGTTRTSLAKLHYLAFRRAPLQSFFYWSREATALIRKLLAENDYAAIVVDHLYAAANIGLARLSAAPVFIYCAHDDYRRQFADIAALQTGWAGRLKFYIDGVKIASYERRLIASAGSVVFLSKQDQEALDPGASRSIVLTPLLDEGTVPVPVAPAPDATTLIFMGGVDFPPNRAALHWLIHDLAPALRRHSPRAKLVLIGAGTDDIVPADATNISGLGFVETGTMNELLRSAAGIISPVVHGSGIKTKVLTGLSQGVMIFATRESLAGLDFLDLEPLVEIGDADGTALRVSELLADPSALLEARKRLIASWNGYLDRRRGLWAEHVREAIAAASAPGTASDRATAFG